MASSTISPDNLNVDIAMSFRLCINCGYTKLHSQAYENDGFREQHFTCLCNLFESSLVCCSKGYSNLLNAIPSLAMFSPLPQSNAKIDVEILNEDPVGISRHEILQLKQDCFNIRLMALRIYHHTYLCQKLIPLYYIE